MKILMTGASGFVGQRLKVSLEKLGHSVVPLSREKQAGKIFWDPTGHSSDVSSMSGFDALIHLAGESIAAGRWTAAKKERIRSSRVDGTRHLMSDLSKVEKPPRVVIGASAIGYYGNRRDEMLTEASAPGKDFLAGVCQEWETAVAAARKWSARVVFARFGIILGLDGGALPKMLFPFRMGVGGKIGSGSQYMSWVSIDDVVRALIHALQNETVSGPVNVVAPSPVRNSEFTKAMGRVLARPTIFPLPAPVARIIMGEMADALLLSSARVSPQKLTASGFQFADSEIEPALRKIISSSAKG